MLIKLLAFIVTILVIVAVHEWGHYAAMRLFRVRVLRFSIGFGPRLVGWTNRAGTEFTLSAIPLGGYVKPLDRRDCEVGEADRAAEFSSKPAWQRVITYAAGPAANLVLAVFLYWLVALGGETVLAPVAGQPEAGTAAAEAGIRHGDEWLSVDGEAVQDWEHVSRALISQLGRDDAVPVRVRNAGEERELSLVLDAWVAQPDQHPLTALGVRPVRLPVAGEISAGSAAERAGMQTGDRVLSVRGEAIDTWEQWVMAVRSSPETPLPMMVSRQGREIAINLVPDAKTDNGETVGLAGVGLAGLKQIHYGPLAAVPRAFERLGEQTVMIVEAMVKLVTGDLSLKSLGGPLTIADAAGQTAAIGLGTFLAFLAFFSISLGIINLMPVPMLDGGWIVFGVYEMVARRPLSERFLVAAQTFGMVFVVGLMLVAIYNDLIKHLA